MEKLTSTARKIDVVFKIADIMLKIGFVTCLVCLGIIAVGVIFNLPTEMIGTVDASLSVDPFTFHIAEGFVPDFRSMLGPIAMMIALGAVACVLALLCVKTIRSILAPMKEGQPFHDDISGHFRKLGWLSLALSLMLQAVEAIGLYAMTAAQHLDTLLISEKVTRVEVNASFDVSVLMIPLVFFLLSYVFRYGAQLQQLSDETL